MRNDTDTVREALQDGARPGLAEYIYPDAHAALDRIDSLLTAYREVAERADELRLWEPGHRGDAAARRALAAAVAALLAEQGGNE